MGDEVILANSGGPDARVVGAIARQLGLRVHSLFLDYNEHIRDGAAPAAERTAGMIGCASHEVIRLPYDFIGWNDDLYGLPQSNLGVAWLGSMYAYKRRAKWLWMGTARDADRSDYLTDFQHIINRTKNPDVVFVRPLMTLPDHRDFVAEKAKELGVSLDDTWSCNHGVPACGECFKCERRKRFGWRNC